MQRYAHVLLVLVMAAGCTPDPIGTACDPVMRGCRDGYACILISRPGLLRRELVNVCHLACERSTDCPGERGCFQYTPSRLSGACLGVGTAAVGEGCESAEDCAPGLRCVSQLQYRSDERFGTCMPGCELFSPHSADRACALGSSCLSFGVSDSDSGSFCAPGCDVAAQTGCEDDQVCVWMEVPGQPDAPMCWPAASLAGCTTVARECDAGQVCGQDGECYAPEDAPPFVVLAVEPPID